MDKIAVVYTITVEFKDDGKRTMGAAIQKLVEDCEDKINQLGPEEVVEVNTEYL